MTTPIQTQSLLNDIAHAQQTKVWKLEQLAKLLTKKGAKLTDWELEIWQTGYKAQLKITEADGQITEVYAEYYIASEGDKIYINPQSKQASVEQLYRSIDDSKELPGWLKFFYSQQANISIADKILQVCSPKAGSVVIKLVPKDFITISYSNRRNSRSLNHKNNYHMLDVAFTITQDLPKEKFFFKNYVFNNTMRVAISDGSSPQNKGCGDKMLAKIEELDDN